MKLVIIDGQGGGLGKAIVEAVKKRFIDLEVLAIGTNNVASVAMRKAGADIVVTGENPVLVASRDADIIIGPIGIVIADALYGEITPAMAVAVGQSRAKKILVPMNQCTNLIVGVEDFTLGRLVNDVILELEREIES